MDVGGEGIAYRSLGAASAAPLVLTQRFRGTMDHWDPELLDDLASERQVIVFDSPGIGASGGTARDSIPAMADAAAGFMAALGIARYDVLGWSMGGGVAQWLALKYPESVRRLVLAGCGPGAVPDAPKAPAKVWQVAGKDVNDDEDFLYLFYPETGEARAAGLASLRRLDRRLLASRSVVRVDAVKAQQAAIAAYASGVDSALPHLSEITAPTLAANGIHDVMVSSYEAYVLAQRIPNAYLALYPHSGHAFHFQHAHLFGRHVREFLR
ncbi:alpha/beta fold hydrolase [Nocardia sp. NPDC101769]|uniref:alpha/beta fold hydrolase n=1 Tax=Nocardia sp. NPDC101769 TaxID=3364333 RepID=UPI0037F95773